jgi:hypothetical protein
MHESKCVKNEDTSSSKSYESETANFSLVAYVSVSRAHTTLTVHPAGELSVDNIVLFPPQKLYRGCSAIQHLAVRGQNEDYCPCEFCDEEVCPFFALGKLKYGRWWMASGLLCVHC